MNYEELDRLADGLIRFRHENIDCDSIKCTDCPLYVSSPNNCCSISNVLNIVLREAEKHEKD